MTDFEFVFLLYALILGLSMVELLTGLGRAMEYKYAREAEHKTFKIGWLTPLLAGFVMLDLISFWLFAWAIREQIAVSSATVTLVIAFAASYYLAARLVFPTIPDAFTDLDDHFYRVRRVVLGILIALVLVQWGYLISQVGFENMVSNLLTVGLTIVLLVLMGAGMISRKDAFNIVVLIALNARYLAIYLIL
ncbi:MAG: hypothetical protein AAGI28_01990 [Pseudomonadota bacterium]